MKCVLRRIDESIENADKLEYLVFLIKSKNHRTWSGIIITFTAFYALKSVFRIMAKIII